MLSFEQYLMYVYRQSNGKSLEPDYVTDILCYCRRTGKLLLMGENGLFKISSPNKANSYREAVKYACTNKYKSPTHALRSYNYYCEFLEYQKSAA